MGCPKDGSVLGPILFLVYIDDLEEGITGNILKCADDTKLFRKTKAIGDNKNLQDDIDKLVRWSEKCQMRFFAMTDMIFHRLSPASYPR